MDEGQYFSMELLKLAFSFLEKIIWPLIALTLIIIIRKSIANIVDRLIRFDFSFGGATGKFEAATPAIKNEKAPQIQADPKDSNEQSPEVHIIQKVETTEPAGWLSQVVDAFSQKNNSLALQILQDTQHIENDPDKRYSNDCFFQYLSFTEGNNSSAIQKLETAYKNSSNDYQLNESASWLSAIYNEVKNFQKSKTLWKNAIERCTNESQKTNFIINFSNSCKNLGELDLAKNQLELRLTTINDDDQKSLIYTAIADTLKETGNIRGQSLALEKAVEYSPGNREKLFDAAFAQSNDQLNFLAISNYSTLISLDPSHATALNNIGVCAGNLKMASKQVDFYKKSKAEGYTLAMANLANLYTDNGFFAEAEEILNEAIKSDDPHENTGDAFYKLKSKKAAEDESWAKAMIKAKDLQREIRAYGEAYFNSSLKPDNFQGE